MLQALVTEVKVALTHFSSSLSRVKLVKPNFNPSFNPPGWTKLVEPMLTSNPDLNVT